MATDLLENHIDHPVSAETMGVVNIEERAPDLIHIVNNSDNEPSGDGLGKSTEGRSVPEDKPDEDNAELVGSCEETKSGGDKCSAEGKSCEISEEEVARKKTFAEQEAMLNEYLAEEDQRKKAEEAAAAVLEQPKPRRKTIAEMLKSLPGNLLMKKPMIRPSTKTVIDLDEDFKTVDDTKKKGIEDLMSRFAIHTAVQKPPKEEHYKLHITRREEDSQGLAQFTTDTQEYVKYGQEESDDEGTSPVATAPGSKMGQVKAKLKAEIRAKTIKAFEEKVKLHAMYSEETDVDGKHDKEDEEEEILLDDDMSESDKSGDEDDGGEAGDEDDGGEADEDEPENEQEEDIEALLDGSAPKESKKKHRKRRVFLEEEASESGEDHSGDEDEDGAKQTVDDIDFIDDRPISEDEGSDIDATDSKVNAGKVKENSPEPADTSFGFEFEAAQKLDNLASQVFDYMSQGLNGISQNLDGMSQDLIGTDQNGMSQDLFSERASQPISQLSQNSPIPSLLDPCKTPKITASLLSHKGSPLAPWNSSRFDSSTMLMPGNNISPLIPRLSSSAALEAFCEDNEATTPTLPSALAKLVGTPASVDEDFLEGICSARFPSQQPETPKESQVYSDCFGFDEDSFDEDPKNNQSLLSNKLLTETPKTGEKVARITRLNFSEVPAEVQQSEAVDSDDDDGSVVGVKVIKKRKRKLEFSDDEDSDAEGPAGEQSAEEEEAEDKADIDPEDDLEIDPEESEKEYDENEEEIPKFNGFFSKKTGKLRKEFVEAEAELSGSEEGSADEDENDMDAYEDEAGDAEDIDEEKLREQVGKAHLKQVLDDDQREINFLQEVFFEDGDLHSDGKGRERKFRWKNMDGDQDFGAIRLNDEANGGDIPEDELEIRRQRDKLDKIKFLQEHNISVDENMEFEETSQKLLDNSQFMKLGKKTLRKIEKSASMCEATTIAAAAAATNTDQSPEPTFVRKGSFLQRENTLTRLAEITKVNDNLSALGKGKGFVFTMVTPPNDPEKSKAGASKRKMKAQQPKKMLKTSSLSVSDTQQNSIFKWM